MAQIAEIYVLRKLEKKKTEERRKREMPKESTMSTGTKSENDTSKLQSGCFSCFQKKIHPSSLPPPKT